MKWLKWFKKPQKKSHVSEELLRIDLKHPGRSGFSFSEKEQFELQGGKGYVDLCLNTSHLFAWSEINDRVFQDFVLSGTLSLDAPYSAAGFLFRQVNEDNFYYFLVSNKGYCRFDVLFNGGPITLLPWMALEEDLTKEVEIRIIAHGNNFVFFVNNRWVAEVSAEYFKTGQVGFTGQNFSDDKVVCRLRELTLESRPIRVETEYTRWNEVVQIPPEDRARLAKAFFQSNNLSSAIFQYRKAVNEGDLSQEDLRLFLQALMVQEFYTEAHQVADLILQKGFHHETYLDKGHLYYLQNSFAPLKTHLQQKGDLFQEDHRYWSLMGHAHHMLGDQRQSAEAYKRAFELNSSVPLYALNSAKSFELLEEWDQAEELYVQAGREFFIQESYEDLEWVLMRLEDVAKDDPRTDFIRGIMAYHNRQWGEAEALFDQLLQGPQYDSRVPFLKGQILQARGDVSEAHDFYIKAASLDEEDVSYQFKVAETAFLLGKDCREPLEKALTLDPENPWVLNLAGKVWGEADYFKKAYEAAPQEASLAVNWASMLVQQNQVEEGIGILEKFPEDPEAVNQLGNIYVNQEDYPKGLALYKRAVKLAPENGDYHTNLLSVALYTDQFSLAEEHLRILLDIRPDDNTLFWAGRISAKIGDYPRALLSFREALSLNPRFREARISLIQLYLGRFQYKEAKEETELLLEQFPENQEGLHFLQRIRNATEYSLHCGQCQREWWVPKNLPEESPLRLRGELPDHVPAGQCPTCNEIYCIQCAKEHLKEGRLYCHKCDEPLKLSRSDLRYLIRTGIDSLS